MDTSIFIGTWWSLVPPLLAIILALVTKEVYSSLFIGVAVGALLYTGFHPWNAFNALFSIMKDSMNLNILIFDVLLGMIIVLMSKSGGSAAYGRWAGSKIRSKKSAMLATTGLGMLIFVDDYFNCLTVGSVMRPVTDRYKVSRAKLAYINDADRCAGLHHCADFQLGGSRQFVCSERCRDYGISAVSANNSVQSLCDSDDCHGIFCDYCRF